MTYTVCNNNYRNVYSSKANESEINSLNTDIIPAKINKMNVIFIEVSSTYISCTDLRSGLNNLDYLKQTGHS